MDIKQTIVDEFTGYIKDTFTNEGVKNFLLNHERKDLLIDNLKREIDGSSHIIMPLDKTLEEKRDLIKQIANQFTRQFCMAAIEVKKAEFESRITTIDDALKAEALQDEPLDDIIE